MTGKPNLKAAIILLVIVFVIIISRWRPPAAFPAETIYTVSKGTGLNQLASNLTARQIIKSPLWFKVFSLLWGGPKGLRAGDYTLTERQNVITLAHRFSTGDFQLVPVSLTIPEGLNVFEMGKLIAKKFPNITAADFEREAGPAEGYLFPDTYLFLPNVSVTEMIKTLKVNFEEKIKLIDKEITTFGKPLADIVKMASLVEAEARTPDTRRIVAGILWQRLNRNMPLQVDSSFKYINGKTTATLTLADLQIDSPYNSYRYKGLPPTPICNPGLDSLRATLSPTKTDYLYFLSDREGVMHYAQTYAGHLQNKQLYLK